jgi:uncharacterized tellurite resistance protein B-like protein
VNIEDFTEPQRQALLDLTVLAMYADGHLAAVEDARVKRLLTTMGYDSDYDRGKHYDAAVSRVSRHSQTPEVARAHAAELSRCFTTQEHRRQVHDILSDLVTSDSQVAPQEISYLAVVKEAFQL